MSDFISKLRQKQLELAISISAAIFYQLPGNTLEDLAMAADSLLFHLPFNARQLKELDITMCATVIRLDITNDTIKTVRGCADWVACKLIRSKNLKPQTIPIMPIRDTFDEIAKKYNVKYEMISQVIMYLWRPGTEIPPLGHMEEKCRLVTDEAALREFAKHYSW